MDVFFTSSQAARELGISQQTVRNYVASGVIKATRSPGGHIRIEPGELDRMKALKSLPTVPRATTGAPTSSNAGRPKNANHILLAAPSGPAIQSAEDAFISDRELAADTSRVQRLRVRREAVELTDFFENRARRQQEEELEQERLLEEQKAREWEQQQSELTARERRQFLSRWFDYALKQRRYDGPDDFALLIRPEVLSTLAEIAPGENESTIRMLVHAAIARALRPSRAANERPRS
jgi:excisionase family DNA binding protein